MSYQVLLNKPEDVENRYFKIWELYEKYMSLFAEELNKIHNTSYSKKYWEVIIGGWLIKYILIVYDKFYFISNTQNYSPQTKQLYPEDLPKMYHLVNYDPIEFIPAWNQYLLDRIFFLCNSKDISVNSMPSSKTSTHKKALHSKNSEKTSIDPIDVFSGVCNNYKYIVAEKSIFENKINSNEQIYEISEIPLNSFYEIDINLRENFLENFYTNDLFNNVFIALLKEHFPVFFLEQYEDICKLIYFKYPNICLKQIFVFFDLFESITKNFFIANQIEIYNSSLINVQHGGGYGIYKNMVLEDWEVRTCDKFITWGWTEHDNSNFYFPAPTIKSGFLLSRTQNNINFDSLLYITGAYARFFNRLSLSLLLCKPKQYISTIKNFLSAFVSNIDKNLVWRPYSGRLDSKDNHVEDILNNLALEIRSKVKICTTGSLYTAANNAALCIFDHNSTSYLETLGANIPTLLFWDERWNKERKSAEPYFAKLREVGILHNTPEELISFIKNKNDEILTWWNSSEVQEARKLFINNFFRPNENVPDYYFREIFGRNIIKKSSKVAIALIFFNRKTVFEVLKAIRSYKPDKLFLIADGGRNEDEAILCQNLRKQVEAKIDWPCQVFKFYSDTNLGCRENIPQGLDKVFQSVDRAIIIEDDCVPSQDFFSFCEEMLERYENNQQIFTISGSNYLSDKNSFENNDYLFSGYAEQCGWATWKRCWEKYDVDLSSWPNYKAEKIIAKTFLKNKEVEYWENIFDKTYHKTIDCSPWDYQWLCMSFANKALSIVPKENMIQNIGFGKDATHTTGDSPLMNICHGKTNWPLRHPKFIKRNKKFDYEYGNLVFYRNFINKRSFINKIIKKFSDFLNF